eukprot:227499_1
MASFLTTKILTDVPNSQRFNEDRLLQYLRSTIDIFPRTGSLKVSKFGFGQSNPTYLLTCNKLQLVLRKKPAGKILKSAHAVEREYRVMSALQNTRVPVPKTYLLCTDSSIIGTPFYICEYVKGIIFTSSHLPKLKPQQRFTIYAELQKVLSAIHSVNLSEVGLTDFSKSTTDHVTRTLNIWNAQFNRSKSRETENIDALNKFYSAVNNYQRRDTESNKIKCLVHGDFRLDNVIFDMKSLRIIAVIDWEISSIGNPLTDVAGFCLPYHQYPVKTKGTSRGLAGIDLTKAGIPNELEFVSAWITGLNVKTSLFIRNFEFPIKDFNFYLAVTLYRNIGVVQGIFKRIRDGNASDTKMFGGVSAKTVLIAMSQQGLNMMNEADIYNRLLVIPKSVQSGDEADYLPRYLEPFRQHFMNSKFFDYRRRLLYFMEAFIYPAEKQAKLFYSNPANERIHWHGMEVLKNKAKDLKLWNLFLPMEHKESPGLTNLQYAPLCEIMGRSGWAPEACNCSAPDTGNMEVLAKYGNKFQKEAYLKPLMEGKIRSCFGMTEPAVASSDARNISCSAIKSSDGKYYIVNGRKHWTSGAMDSRCKICILMVKTDFYQTQYSQQSMLICPMNLRGVKIVRHLTVFGYSHLPHGHAEVIFDNVKVPAENLILGEGKGFEIAQGRLGPGRIHHCMRTIGTCEVALKLMKRRCLTRYAFGKHLYKFQSLQHDIAEARVDINMLRLLVLQAAFLMDTIGAKNRLTRQNISMIKVKAANIACKIVDNALQAFGGRGVMQDTPLAHMYAGVRTLRLADGADAVHQLVVARNELLQAKL